ncbi:MAG: hypothetical protein KDK78_03240, partial [Chlamydiia bacterium]|nr:hypothetical protein [Chlamydiia bacterium]
RVMVIVEKDSVSSESEAVATNPEQSQGNLGSRKLITLQDANGNTMLHHAAREVQVNVVQTLLAKMTAEEVGLPNKHGQSAIDQVCSKRWKYDPSRETIAKLDSIMALLVTHTSHEDLMRARDGYGHLLSKLSVHRSCFQEAKEIALGRMSLDDLSIPDQDGRTLLHCAAAAGNNDLLLAILSKEE